MAIRIEERFAVAAPVGAVWSYLVDPRRVVGCLPGAELLEVKDDRTFLGAVKVKVGPVTVAYKGAVKLLEVDEAGRRVRMSGEGRETGGAGSARMTMESRLTPLPGGGTEVLVTSEVDVVGKLVQLGRGMIEQVSHQIFQQFSACVARTLEAEAGGRPEAAGRKAEPLAAIPLLLRAIWAAIVAFFRRLLGMKE